MRADPPQALPAAAPVHCEASNGEPPLGLVLGGDFDVTGFAHERFSVATWQPLGTAGGAWQPLGASRSQQPSHAEGSGSASRPTPETTAEALALRRGALTGVARVLLQPREMLEWRGVTPAANALAAAARVQQALLRIRRVDLPAQNSAVADRASAHGPWSKHDLAVVLLLSRSVALQDGKRVGVQRLQHKLANRWSSVRHRPPHAHNAHGGDAACRSKAEHPSARAARSFDGTTAAIKVVAVANAIGQAATKAVRVELKMGTTAARQAPRLALRHGHWHVFILGPVQK